MGRLWLTALLLLSACTGTIALPGDRAPSSTTTVAVVPPRPTTTVTAGSPPSITVPETGLIGYVGCSVTLNAIDGYQRLGGSRFWPGTRGFSGGSVSLWVRDISEASRFWSGFQDLLDSHSDTSAIWWQLCTSKGRPADGYENALVVLAELRQLAPGVPVYVSGQPEYTEGHVCGIAGAEGPSFMQQVAGQLVTNRDALPGPLVGPLDPSQTRDGCHADDEGRELMGEQLLDFFG